MMLDLPLKFDCCSLAEWGCARPPDDGVEILRHPNPANHSLTRANLCGVREKLVNSAAPILSARIAA